MADDAYEAWVRMLRSCEHALQLMRSLEPKPGDVFEKSRVDILGAREGEPEELRSVLESSDDA